MTELEKYIYQYFWCKMFPEKYKASHDRRQWKAQGILLTLAEYKQLRKSQGNKCIICKRRPKKTHNKLAVDHDHKTGKVRGLLCLSCNYDVGLIENKVKVKKINAYLNKDKTK